MRLPLPLFFGLVGCASLLLNSMPVRFTVARMSSSHCQRWKSGEMVEDKKVWDVWKASCCGFGVLVVRWERMLPFHLEHEQCYEMLSAPLALAPRAPRTLIGNQENPESMSSNLFTLMFEVERRQSKDSQL
ncbi:hypothetical protein L210DRAFT_3578847 [Boletus edulis BED1]|uniref:Secreted protein n=1 Tax=Boletus edulis BED1 TaxID=1328754 RepID=A0AAD4G618_BOLED|nr:hypothetical protein L210DRAFT_3578847 [Boletus edulis BED1]